MIAVVIAIGALAVGAAWAVSSPVGSSPDDDYHLASIWCPPPIETSGCTVTTDDKGKPVAVVPYSVSLQSMCFRFDADTSAACPEGTSPTGTSRFDVGSYPGGFYHVMHLFTSSTNPVRSVLVMRLVNVLVAVMLGFGVWAFGGRAVGRLMAYAVLGSFVPLGLFVIPSTNPSSWAVTGVATAFLGLMGLAAAVRRTEAIGSGVLAVIGAVLAGNARTDAGPYLCMIAVAAVIAVWGRYRSSPLKLIGPAVVAIAGAVTFLRGTMVSGFTREGMAAAEGYDTSTRVWSELLVENLEKLPGLISGSYGTWHLGWLDTPMPTGVWVPTLMVAGGLCLAGLREMSISKFLALGLAAGMLVAVPLYLLMGAKLRVGEVVQPRYLLPLLPVVVGLCAVGVRRRPPVGITPVQAAVVWAAMVGAQAVALMTELRRYVTGYDGPQVVGEKVEWWWHGLPGPFTVWLVGSIAFAIAAFGIVVASLPIKRRSVRSEPSRAGEPGRAVAAAEPDIGPSAGTSVVSPPSGPSSATGPD